MYEERLYRDCMKAADLVSYIVVEEESDLHISSGGYFKEEAAKCLSRYRKDIMDYASFHKSFYTSLVPINAADNAPKIVMHMAKAAALAGVGPMASVAGAISQYVGNALLKYTDEVIIENGGDLFINSKTPRKVLIYAGNSPFSNKIAVSISPSDTPLGICTSAGTIGHSLSFGRADAAVVVSKDTLLADAAATAVGNMVSSPDDINGAIEFAASIDGVDGVLIIIGDKLGAWGNIQVSKP